MSLDEILIEDIVTYIRANNGPDENGSGHPDRKRLECGDLEVAIERAEQRDLAPGLKPYHFNSTMGVWKDESYVDEVVVKKIDQLLAEKYDNDLVSLIVNTDKIELIKPLTEHYNGRELKVKVSAVASAHFDNCPFKIVSKYIQLKGLQKEYSNLRPYHFARTTRDTYKDENNVNEVLVKKIEQLLATEKYSNNLTKLVMEVDKNELSTPLIDKLNNKEVSVSMFHVLSKFKSVYRVLKRYHEVKSLEFPFTEDCFYCSPETRRKRIAEVCARTGYQGVGKEKAG